MLSLAGLLALAITLFISTNVDDLVVLVSFFAHPRFRVSAIIAGQYLGIVSLFIASLTSSLLGLVIPHTYLGLLGIAPVLIGLKKLWDLRQPPGETDHASGHAGISLFKQAAGVAMVTIANGGDNLGVYIPFLAVRSKVEIIWIALVFLVMTGAWCGMAYAMVRHPRVGAPIQRYGHIIAPVVLIVLGLVILYQAGSFGLLSHHLH